MDKAFGKLSEAQVEQFSTMVQSMFSQITELRNHMATNEKAQQRMGSFICQWSQWYEIPFANFLAIFFWTFKLDGLVKAAAQSTDPQQEVLNGVLSFETLNAEGDGIRLPFETKDLDPAELENITNGMTFSLIMAVLYSTEALGLYGQTIDELLEIARKGDKAKLLEAVLVDPSTIATTVGQKAMSWAVLTEDRGFLETIAKAITKTKPRPPANEHKATRYLIAAIYRSGVEVSATQQTVREMIVDGLGLYNTDRDPERALQKLMNRLFQRWET